MTTNIELDSFSGSLNEHSASTEHGDQTSPAEIRVAQATATQQPAPAASEPVPVDVGGGAPVKPEAPAEAKAPPAAAPHEYVADASHVVRLPANASIDNIKVDGQNLLLEQADGSVIVIKDGALNVPTFIIGDVEVPRVALLAALEASHVDVAFGADGSISAGPGGSNSSAGGDFSVPPGGIGDGFDLSALLPPTALQFGLLERRELFPSIVDRQVTVTATSLLAPTEAASETGLDGGGAQSPGSDAPSHSETSGTGTISITAPDGIGSVVINGVTVTAVGDTIFGKFGYITIVSFNPTTGAIEYNYTVTESVTHSNQTNGFDPNDTVPDNFSITVTDVDGDSASTTFAVAIVDDVPTAVADNATQATENAAVTVNVFANDVPGADGVNITDPTKVSYVAGSLAGGAGTVTYHNDGTFTYAPVAGEEGTVTFQYQIIDGDGDSSVATVTINLLKDSTPTIDVTPQAPDASGHSAVNEAGLAVRGIEPAGSGEIADNNGTNNSDPSETATGSLNITTGGDTIGHLYVTDKDNTQIEVTNAAGGILVHGQYGDLTITGTPGTGYTYSYTLLDNSSGNTTHDDFAVQVVDTDGDPASTTLTINIVDDVPTAHADTDAVQSGETVTGNVETGTSTHGTGAADTAGADGIASIAWTGIAGTTVTGTYGVLTVDANGGYSYHANPSASGVDIFNYTITDGDGDTSPSTLTITVSDGTPQPVAATVKVDEAALDTSTTGDDIDHGTATGTNPSSAAETVTGTLTLGDPDSPHVTNIAGATSSAVGGIPVTVQGTYGVLQIDQDGHYTYTLMTPFTTAPATDNGAVTEPGKDVFTYTVTDSFGNSSTSTISVDIIDDVPSVTASATQPPLTVDESNLGQNATASFASVFTPVFGADGAAAANSVTYALGFNAGATGLVDTATGQAVVLSLNGTVVEGRTAVSNELVFTVATDASGNVTLDQQRAVVHPNAADPNDAKSLSADNLITLTATVTDKDGDTATATANIGQNLTFLDDGPSVTASATQPPLTVDESNLGQNATASFASVFTPVFGADGAAAANSVTYALGFNAGATGLVDTATGQAVVLSLNGTVVEGRTAVSNELVFTVATDASGNVTLDQQRAVVHPNAADPNDAKSLSADNLITLTATVTDKDGDTATATANIGQNLTFLDDGPSVTVTAASAVKAALDETATSSGVATINTGAIVKGDDPDVSGSGYISTATSVGALVTVSALFGADGPAASASTAYALAVTNANSGLTLTDGSAISLQLVGTAVVGVVSGGTFNGQAAFAISINATTGAVTVEQYLSLDHPNEATTANSFNSYDETITLANGSLGVTVTVTDGDNDTATSNTADVSNQITFDDDGPTLGAFTSGTIPNEVGSVAGLFSLVSGADGLDHFNITGPVIAGITYTTTTAADGTTILHANSGATEVFSLTVRSDATYEFDLVTPQATTIQKVNLLTLSAGNANFAETADGSVEFTSSGTVNSSNTGFGVNNQFLDNGESFTMEFHTSSPTIVDTPAIVNPSYVDSVLFKGLNDSANNGTLTINWTAVNTSTGQTQTGSAVWTDPQPTLLIDPTITFNQLTLSAVGSNSAKLRLDNADISKTILPSDVTLDFHIAAVDKDGDATPAQTLSIHEVAGDAGGNFTLPGFAGTVNDVIAGSTHIDTITGGAGTDIADYTGSLLAVSINLADDGHANAAAFSTTPADATIGGGDATGDTLTGIEGLIGGSGDDYLYGNSGANYLAGGLGNDTLRGEGGADTLIGGAGNDLLVGGAGSDTLTGGTGADTFRLENLDIKDLITDFSGVGGDGDKIDLTALFDSAPANVGNFVNYDAGTGTLSVDTSGSGNPANFVEVAQLVNHPAANTITLLYDDGVNQHTTTANVV
ncbi:DUF5801 repeats-in-toxin domain-containing protein [Mesorhizobium sp.]|uniref:DUF5801 repeats-in-toxin domain-containing protein n=2 Tax=Mesorhizobium sp. TaxID=1871066 RepID=UPI00120ACB87|nr:DUF5801 repeats-in-toxin domain-containing protein [Mesorhizobium sp.]TIX28404.1 MAG: type I secretion C-terminal target domain-containing protein [Mesorhizobium sp.]